MARHSLVYWTAQDQLNLNAAVQQMLQAILAGLNNTKCKYVRFVFGEPFECKFRGKAHFYEECGPETRVQDSTEVAAPRDLRYLYSDGLGARAAMDLLESEVSKLCFAMTQGQMFSSGGAYSETHNTSGPWAVLFCKDGSEVAARIRQQE